MKEPKVKLLPCGHRSYWKLNDTMGCIHEDHGPFPPIHTPLPESRRAKVKK